VYLFTGLLHTDKGYRMIIKLASAILAGAGIALAIAPPAIAGKYDDYIAALAKQEVLSQFKSKNQAVAAGKTACTLIMKGKGLAEVSESVQEKAGVDPLTATTVAVLAGEVLCKMPEFNVPQAPTPPEYALDPSGDESDSSGNESDS
jgi:hypothetical protein